MADAGEGLIDAQNRIQERMDEREEERARRATAGRCDPEKVRRAESLRLAYTELSRQLETTTHTARRQQLSNALAELERQLEGDRRTPALISHSTRDGRTRHRLFVPRVANPSFELSEPRRIR